LENIVGRGKNEGGRKFDKTANNCPMLQAFFHRNLN
jgi:hypothetical protein